MEDILARLLVADNNVIQKASKDLREAYKKDDSITELCSVVLESSNPQIRQYAAVLLRQRFSKSKYWDRLHVDVRTRIKDGILRALIFEPEKFVKKAVAQLIGTLVRYEVPKNNWPELLEFIFKTCNSQDDIEKTLGMFTLSIITEISPNQFIPHAQAVGALVINAVKGCLDDTSPMMSYCIDTMRNLVSIADEPNGLNCMYRLLMPKVLQTLRIYSQTNEIKACEVMDMFDDLIESGIITHITDLKLLIDMSIAFIQNTALGELLRIKALTILESSVKSKKKAIIKQNLLPPILEIVFQVMKSPSTDGGRQNDDSESPVSAATQVLDSLALHLPPNKLMPALLQHIQVGLDGEDPYGKKAAYMAMAVVAEGCAEYIRGGYLEKFMDLVCEGLVDSLPLVRDSALYALGQFSEYLQPDISKHSERLMPILFNFLEQLGVGLSEGRAEPISMDRVFYALETFIENSEKSTFLPYLNMLMERLLSLIVLDSSTHFKELVLSLIGACALAAEDDIYPFFARIVECLSIYLKQRVPEELVLLQTQSIDTLSTLARSVTPEHFHPISQESIQLGLKLLEEQTDPDLRRSAYGLFGSISLILKEEMGTILSPVVRNMMASIESSDGVVLHYRDSGVPLGDELSDTPEEEDIEQTDDEDDDEEEDDFAGYTVENAYLDEKTAACLAIKEIAINAGIVFNPYLEPCFEGIFKLLICPQEDVRKIALDSLCQLCVNFSKCNTEEGSIALKKALSAYIPKCAEIIRTDTEREVVMQALESYTTLLKNMKSLLFFCEGHKEAIINCVRAVFGRRTACQDTDEDSDNDDGTAEQDEMLIECAGDVVPYFGKAITPDEFVPVFVAVMPYLTARFKRQCTIAQRSFGIGILAECMEPLGPRLNQFIHQVMPAFLSLCQDDHHDIRNNAIFGLGELLYHGKEHLFVHYGDILRLLSQIVSQEQDPSVLDNICGALARMILANTNLVPLNEVFPCLMRLLPLRVDYKENFMLYKCLLHLYEGGHELLLHHLDDILVKTVAVIHKKQGEDDALLLAERFFLCAHRDFPDRVCNLRPNVPVEMKSTYELLLNK